MKQKRKCELRSCDQAEALQWEKGERGVKLTAKKKKKKGGERLKRNQRLSRVEYQPGVRSHSVSLKGSFISQQRPLTGALSLFTKRSDRCSGVRQRRQPHQQADSASVITTSPKQEKRDSRM